MKIKIIYDNNAVNNKFDAGWGFSCLVGDNVLFDTGQEGESLVSNVEKFGIDISKIKKIAISHDHWDHTGGIESILKISKGVKVYGLSGFSEEFKNRVEACGGKFIDTGIFQEIESDIFLVNDLSGKYNGAPISEQVLAIHTENGISILTGCAHPGIVSITDSIIDHFPGKMIYAVIGGFHLKEMNPNDVKDVCMDLKNMGVQKAGPAHCTGEGAKAVFKKEFKNSFIETGSGVALEL